MDLETDAAQKLHPTSFPNCTTCRVQYQVTEPVVVSFFLCSVHLRVLSSATCVTISPTKPTQYARVCHPESSWYPKVHYH